MNKLWRPRDHAAASHENAKPNDPETASASTAASPNEGGSGQHGQPRRANMPPGDRRHAPPRPEYTPRAQKGMGSRPHPQTSSSESVQDLSSVRIEGSVHDSSSVLTESYAAIRGARSGSDSSTVLDASSVRTSATGAARNKSKLDKIRELLSENADLKEKNLALMHQLEEMQRHSPKAEQRKASDGDSPESNASVALLKQQHHMLKRDHALVRQKFKVLREERNMLKEDATKYKEDLRSTQAEKSVLLREIQTKDALAKTFVTQFDKCMKENSLLSKALEEVLDELKTAQANVKRKTASLQKVKDELRDVIDSQNGGGASESVYSIRSEMTLGDDVLRQLDKVLNAKDMALGVAKAEEQAQARKVAALKDLLDAARREANKSRAEADFNVAEMEKSFKAAKITGSGEAQRAKEEVRAMQDKLDERTQTIMKLQLEIESTEDEMQYMAEHYEMEKQEMEAEFKHELHQKRRSPNAAHLSRRVAELEAENERLRNRIHGKA